MKSHKYSALALSLAVIAMTSLSIAVSTRQLAERAMRAEAQGDLAGAARSLEELVSAGVDDSDVLYDLGTVYSRSGRYGEAIWRFETVARRHPFDWNTQDNLRATRVRLARRDAARTGRAVVEHEPSFSVQLGEVLPLDVSVPLVALTEFVVLGLWLWRWRTRSELQRVGAAAAMALTAIIGLFSLSVVITRKRSPPSAIVLRDGLHLGQSARVDAIPDAAVREGDRVERLGRDGEFTRVRTPTGNSGWLRTRDLGVLEP